MKSPRIPARRSYRQFLLLELLIALVLVGLCIFPLATVPLSALKEDYNSAYRMQTQRLADLAFADVKQKLYSQELPWKEIVKSRTEKIFLLKDSLDVHLEPQRKRKFLRQVTLKSRLKKGLNSEEWFLATFNVTITPEDKKIQLFRTKKKKIPCASRTFVYQVLIGKTAVAAPLPPQENS